MSWISKNLNLFKRNLGFFSLIIFSINGSLFAQVQPLPAPTISVENPVEVNTSSFSLSWDALDETNFYNFELCADAACVIKIKEVPKAGKPSVSLSDIRNGQFYWRVSGVAPNNQIGKYSTPQPLLVALLPVLNQEEVSEDGSSEITTDGTFLEILFSLPWYMHLILLAYVIYITRILIWYFNK